MLHKIDRRRTQAQSIIEMAAGLLILVPVVLFLLDLVALVLAQTTNDELAQHAARAAGSQPDQTTASAAVQSVIANFKTSPMIPTAPIGTLQLPYPDANGGVTVTTQIVVTLPVPVPFMGATTVPFTTHSSGPIVVTKAP